MVEEKRLVTKIEDEAASDFTEGKINNFSDIGCSVFTVMGSFLATVLVAAGAGRPWIAGVAALPALFASLQRAVDFRGRASWYFLFAARRRALARALEHEGASAKDVSQRLSKLEIDMEERWAGMVRSKIGKSRRKD